MKILFIIVTVVVISLGGIYFVTKNNKSVNNSASLTMQTIQNDATNGAQLVDVRTAQEYSSGHIVGAVNISLQDIQAGKLPTASKDKTIYVYCHSGNRSSQATKILKTAGYNVVDLGAITHVQSIGGTIIQS